MSNTSTELILFWKRTSLKTWRSLSMVRVVQPLPSTQIRWPLGLGQLTFHIIISNSFRWVNSTTFYIIVVLLLLFSPHISASINYKYNKCLYFVWKEKLPQIQQLDLHPSPQQSLFPILLFSYWSQLANFKPPTTSPIRIVKKDTPSTAPKAPPGPAGSPLPVCTFVNTLHPTIAVTTR